MVGTCEGCIDILTLGAFLEFSPAVSRPHYSRTISLQEVEEENAARWKYRQFLRWYQFNYVVGVHGSVYDTNYMANYTLLQYAVALVKYARKFQEELSGELLNAKSLRTAVLNHLHQDWPELTEAFLEKEKEEGHVGLSLVWPWGPFEVIRRREETEVRQDSFEHSVYVPLPPDDDSADDSADDGVDDSMDDEQDSAAAKRKRDGKAGRDWNCSLNRFIFLRLICRQPSQAKALSPAACILSLADIPFPPVYSFAQGGRTQPQR